MVFNLVKRGVMEGHVPPKQVLDRVLKASLVEGRISMRSAIHEEVDLIAFAHVFRLAKECPDHDLGLESMNDILGEELKEYHRTKVTPKPGLFDNEKGIVRACVITLIRYVCLSWASQNPEYGA